MWPTNVTSQHANSTKKRTVCYNWSHSTATTPYTIFDGHSDDMDTNLINFILSVSVLSLHPHHAVRPLTVKIIQDLKFMSTKQSYDLKCEVRGSRPAPKISWWLGSLQLTATKETVRIRSTSLSPRQNDKLNYSSSTSLIIFMHANLMAAMCPLALHMHLLSRKNPLRRGEWISQISLH